MTYNQGMKRLLLALTLAIGVPAVAFAQQGPPPPNGPGMGWHSPSPAMRAQMRADFQKMRALHQQFRAQVLGALTPAHKQLLASVVGNLAIAASPDPKAAIKQLDDALSPSEKTAILNAAKSFHEQVAMQMKQMRANFPRPIPSGAVVMKRRSKWMHGKHTPSAGGILLMAATGRGGFGDRVMIRFGAHPGPSTH